MHDNLKEGLKYEFETIAKPEHSAKFFASGSVDVFSTPFLIASMEMAAFEAVQPALEEGYTTVGTNVNINHIAATPIGMKVKFNATLVAIQGRKLEFQVEAFDEKEKIGFGKHERHIINIEKFMDKVNNKNM